MHFDDKSVKKNRKIRYDFIDNYLTSKYNAYSDIVKKNIEFQKRYFMSDLNTGNRETLLGYHYFYHYFMEDK